MTSLSSWAFPTLSHPTLPYSGEGHKEEVSWSNRVPQSKVEKAEDERHHLHWALSDNRVTNCPEEGFTEIQSIQANTHQSQQTAASDHKMQPATWCWERKTSELHGKSSNSLLISWHSLMACGLLAYYLTLFDCFIAHGGPLFCDLFLLFSGSCIYWLVHTSLVSKCSFPFQVRINTQRLCKHLGPSQVKHITSLIRSSMKWNKMEPTSCREVALIQWKLLYFRISMEPPTFDINNSIFPSHVRNTCSAPISEQLSRDQISRVSFHQVFLGVQNMQTWW